MNRTPFFGPTLLRQIRTTVMAVLLVLVALRPAAAETNAASNIGLKLLADGLGAPIALASIPDGSGRLLIAEQAGVIHVLDQSGKKSEQPFLDKPQRDDVRPIS